jgi:hypothetical protein
MFMVYPFFLRGRNILMVYLVTVLINFMFFWICVSILFELIQYPLFGYRLCFSVVYDMWSESDPHPAETVFLHVPSSPFM